MRSSKDIARRLRLRGYPGRDTFRRWYLLVGLGAAAAGLAGWALLHFAIGPRQFLPRPVSSNHALFGDNCESCHAAFEAVANEKCLACHPPRMHAANEVDAPDCAHCHAEHRDTDLFLSVSEKACVQCHGNLVTQGQDATVEKHVDSFDAHPEFAPLRDGKRDPARLRFNHAVHLSSAQIPEQERPLSCAACHRLQVDGRRMEPMNFEKDCKRCHLQIVDGPTGSIEALHEDPALVREDLRLKLLDAAASIGTVTSEELRRQLDKLATPNPELLFPSQLPGRVARSGFSKERLSIAALEQELYKPYTAPASDIQPPPSPYEINRNCFLCHDGKPAGDEPGEMPYIEPTKISARWLAHADFSHRRHELMPCESCHTKLRDSRDTAEVNLPGKDLCQQCHMDGTRESAGTVCMTCHLYHDTSKVGVTAAVPASVPAGEPLRSPPWWKEHMAD